MPVERFFNIQFSLQGPASASKGPERNNFCCSRGRSIHYIVLPLFLIMIAVFSCKSPRQMGRTGIPDKLLENPALYDAHTGIAIYDADNRELIYSFNSDRFFIPASNTKIATLYAGLRYLDDGIPGLQYLKINDTIFLRATGDPTFLVHYFQDQPVFDFLRSTRKPLVFIKPGWQTSALGYGWPWNFYLEHYMAERSPFPVYGNVVRWMQRDMTGLADDVQISYVLSNPGHRWPVEIINGREDKLLVTRPVSGNTYTVSPGIVEGPELIVPFSTDVMIAALELLSDTLRTEIGIVNGDHLPAPNNQHELHPDGIFHGADCCNPIREDFFTGYIEDDQDNQWKTIYSREADSLFRPMMIYSHNLFAEQILLMVSHRIFGVMDETRAIEFLLENDLGEMPQKARWVDGSGLSRYNLFSPLSFVWLLEKMKDEHGWERVSRLFPTGGEGTLGDYYLGNKGNIFAKTGTLGGNAIALSGYLVTEGGRTLIFSILVNNHNKESREPRKAVEEFLKEIISRY